MKRPLAVALTGGIAAGKSEALAAFARHGAATASADAIVHDLLAKDADVREAIRERWGDDAVGDREHIAAVVFGDRVELDWLEQRLADLLVVLDQVVDDLVARDRGGAVPRERL